MKLLPCTGSERCRQSGAMLPRSPSCPQGYPAIAGRYVRQVFCYRCGTLREITPVQWARLPELTCADFDRLAGEYKVPRLADLPTQDFEGYGMPREHARDLHDAGFRAVEELESLER